MNKIFLFIQNIVKSMRPKQWTKNLLIFAAPIFSGKLFQGSILQKTIVGFFVLCLISGSIYILNDVVDRKRDIYHPKKRNRPIASGKLSPKAAITAFIFIASFSFAVSLYLGRLFFLFVLSFFTLQIFYSFYLKNIVLIDVFSIAAGFLIRALAGSAIAGVSMSSWLFICAVLLALFLGFGKRRHELISLEGSVNHRSVLSHYNMELLDSLIIIVSSSVIVCYALYTFFSSTSERHPALLYSIPFVVYGIFRYLYLIYSKKLGGNPEEILLSDLPLLIDVLIWLCVVFLAIYLD